MSTTITTPTTKKIGTDARDMEVSLDATGAPVGASPSLWSESPAEMNSLRHHDGRFFFLRVEAQRDAYVGRLASTSRALEGSLARFTSSDRDDSLVGWTPEGAATFTSPRDAHPRIYRQALGSRSLERLSDEEMLGFAMLQDGSGWRCTGPNTE